MRKQFIIGGTRASAKMMCPWAAVILKVIGGWACFESVGEAALWRLQRQSIHR
jgi:hypothetical protein